MKRILLFASALVLSLLPGLPANAAGKPYVDGKFKGRIAWSADGNHNDRDDWCASPVALAIFAEAGVKDRVVHFDYNCILTQTDPEWEKIHADSVLGAMEKYGFNKAAFFDCRKTLDAAVNDIAKAINDSSADNPLYFVIAGPMEVPYMGIQKSDPAKRKFVYCISHSRWNDGFSSKYKFTFNKRSVIEQDVNWLQIPDQNRLLSLSKYGQPAKPEEFAGFFWMRDSKDPKVNFLWERTLISTRPDPSDAGMAYFLVTGDEDCDPTKLKQLIENHTMPSAWRDLVRKQVRLEAENFRHFENFKLEESDKTTSQRLVAGMTGGTGKINTRFDEPFTATQGKCDVEIRCLDAKQSHCKFTLLINGVAKGAPWETGGDAKHWATQKVSDVEIRSGDEIAVTAQGEGGKVDYVQVNYR